MPVIFVIPKYEGEKMYSFHDQCGPDATLLEPWSDGINHHIWLQTNQVMVFGRRKREAPSDINVCEILLLLPVIFPFLESGNYSIICVVPHYYTRISSRSAQHPSSLFLQTRTLFNIFSLWWSQNFPPIMTEGVLSHHNHTGVVWFRASRMLSFHPATVGFSHFAWGPH